MYAGILAKLRRKIISFYYIMYAFNRAAYVSNANKAKKNPCCCNTKTPNVKRPVCAGK